MEKLGLRPGMRAILLEPPAEYAERLRGIATIPKCVRGTLDWIQFFVRRSARLRQRFPVLKRHLAENGMLWIAWPKLSSGVESDLSERVVRELGLANGLVDVKVVSVNGTWSALKFVRRRRDRGFAGWNPPIIDTRRGLGIIQAT